MCKAEREDLVSRLDHVSSRCASLINERDALRAELDALKAAAVKVYEYEWGEVGKWPPTIEHELTPWKQLQALLFAKART